MQGIFENLHCLSLFDDPARVHNRKAVCDIGMDAHIMGDQDDSIVEPLLNLFEELDYPLCTTTSRAVVGSSAKITLGCSRAAKAMATLCRIPPES
jgi:hypothetical protein